MLLFLMIPLTLVAFGVAVGPVLAMTVVEHRRGTWSGHLAAGPGGLRPVPVHDDRELVGRT